MARKNFLSQWALGGCFFAICVIALGAFTRLMDAGLGCPDWPGCYGQMIVSTSHQSIKAWTEMIHRYFVGGLSLFLLGIIFVIFCEKKYRVTHNMILAGVLVILLGYQIILGKFTVTYQLLPIIVTQHLLGGYLILSTLWIIYLKNHHPQVNVMVKNKKILLFGSSIACVFLLMQITLGAWTSTHYASLSCPDFPFCVNDQPVMKLYFKEAFDIFSPIGINYEGGVLPEAVRQTIQFLHRIGALILTSYLLFFSIFAILKLKKSPELIKTLYIIITLLCVQVCLGIANVIFKLPLIVAIGHNIFAVLLLLSMITFIFNISVCYNRAVIL